jgi:hypothetical protein
MTAALEGGEWSAARSGRTLPPGNTRYPFYRRLGGSHGRSERTENLVPTGIRSRTVQPVVTIPTELTCLLELKNKKNQLDVTCYFYFSSYILNTFRALICPSSGVCDYVFELPHWLISFLVCSVLELGCGSARVVSGLQAVRIPPYKIHTRHINTLCGRNVEFLHISTWWFIQQPLNCRRLTYIPREC